MIQPDKPLRLIFSSTVPKTVSETVNCQCGGVRSAIVGQEMRWLCIKCNTVQWVGRTIMRLWLR